MAGTVMTKIVLLNNIVKINTPRLIHRMKNEKLSHYGTQNEVDIANSPIFTDESL